MSKDSPRGQFTYNGVHATGNTRLSEFSFLPRQQVSTSQIPQARQEPGVCQRANRSKISPTRLFSVSPDQDSLPIYTVCVVGYPKSGKSCLCNRFVCPHPDFYEKVHTSVISSTDFAGPVINSEHWLFWGTVVRRIDEETNARFRVVEQTEFVNDATFCPFVSPKISSYQCRDSHSSSTHNEYVRRSTSVKLYSPNKLRYICTEQLGHEQRYGEEYLPDRELEITGFLLLFDVSQRLRPDTRDLPGGCAQDQFSFFAEILSVLLKRKKPLVLVATKRDKVDEQVLQEFHQMLQKSSDFKRVPLIEVSSHCNINVELAFGTIVRLADNKPRFSKIRPLSYQEASRERDEEYRIAREAFVNHILRCSSEFLVNWQSFMSRYSHQVDVTRFVNLVGSTAAQSTFEQFSELQKIETKRRHMANLPNAIRALLPHVGPVTNQAPEVILERLRAHPDFDSYFLNDDTPSDVSSGTQNATSQEQALDGKCIRIGRQDNRIPFSLALKRDRPDRLCVFLECFSDLACLERWSAQMCAFESILYEYQLVTTHLAAEHLDTPAPCQPILPGQTFEDFRTQFSAFHNITDLSLDDQCVVYMRFQEILRTSAREEFLDLLLDNYSLFIDGVSSYLDRLQESSTTRANYPDLVAASFDAASRRTCLSDQDNSLSPNRSSSTSSSLTESRRLLRIQTCDAQLLTAGPPPKGAKEEQLALISAKLCSDPRYKRMDYLPSERQTYLTNCFDFLLHDPTERVLAPPPPPPQTNRLSWTLERQDNCLSLGRSAHAQYPPQNANFPLPPSSSVSSQPPPRLPLLVCPSHSSGRCMDSLFASYCRLAAGRQAPPVSEHGREARVLSNRLSRFIGQSEELLSIAVCCVCADVLAAAAAMNLLQCAGFLPEDLATSSNSLDSPISSGGRLSSQRLFSSWPLSSTLLAEASLSAVGASSPLVDAVQATLLSHHELAHNILCDGNAQKRTSSAVYDGVIFILSSADWEGCSCPQSTECCSSITSNNNNNNNNNDASARWAPNNDSPGLSVSSSDTEHQLSRSTTACSCCQLVFANEIKQNGLADTTNSAVALPSSTPPSPRRLCCCGLCHAPTAPGFRQRSLVSRVACVSSILRLLGPIPSLLLSSSEVYPQHHGPDCDNGGTTTQSPTTTTTLVADDAAASTDAFSGSFFNFLPVSHAEDCHSPQTPIARCKEAGDDDGGGGGGKEFCTSFQSADATPSLLTPSNAFTFDTARPGGQYKMNTEVAGSAEEEQCGGTGRKLALDTLTEFLECCWTAKRDHEAKRQPVCTPRPQPKTNNRESCPQGGGSRSSSRTGGGGFDRRELRTPVESSPSRAKTTPSSSSSISRLFPQRRCRHRYHRYHHHHHPHRHHRHLHQHHLHHNHRKHHHSHQPLCRSVLTSADGIQAASSRSGSTVRESACVSPTGAADSTTGGSSSSQPLPMLVSTPPPSSDINADLTLAVPPLPSARVKDLFSAMMLEPGPQTTEPSAVITVTSLETSSISAFSLPLRPTANGDRPKAVLGSSSNRLHRFRSVSVGSSLRRVPTKTAISSAKTQSNSVSTVCGHDPIKKSDSESDLPRRLLSVSAGNCNSVASSSSPSLITTAEDVGAGFPIPSRPQFSHSAPESHSLLLSVATSDTLPADSYGDTPCKLDRYVTPPPPVVHQRIHILTSCSQNVDFLDSELEELFDNEQDSLAAGHMELLPCRHTGLPMPPPPASELQPTRNKSEPTSVSNPADAFLTLSRPAASTCSTMSSHLTTSVSTVSCSSTSSISFLGSGMVSGFRAAYSAVGGLARPRERRRSVSTPGGGDSLLVGASGGGGSIFSAAAGGSGKRKVTAAAAAAAAIETTAGTPQFLRGSAPLTMLKSATERSQFSASPAAAEANPTAAACDSIVTSWLGSTTASLVPNADCIRLVVSSLAALLSTAARRRQTASLPHYHHWHHPSCAHRLCVDGPLRKISNSEGAESVNKSGQTGVSRCPSASALCRSVNFGNSDCSRQSGDAVTTPRPMCPTDLSPAEPPPSLQRMMAAAAATTSPLVLSVVDRKLPFTSSHSHQSTRLSQPWFSGGGSGNSSCLSGSASSASTTLVDAPSSASTDVETGRPSKARHAVLQSSMNASSSLGSPASATATPQAGTGHVTKESTRWSKRNMKLSLFSGRHPAAATPSDSPGVPTGTRTISVPSTPVRETVLQATSVTVASSVTYLDCSGEDTFRCGKALKVAATLSGQQQQQSVTSPNSTTDCLHSQRETRPF